MSRDSGTLLCWHAEQAGLGVLEGALDGLSRRDVRVDHVLYLVQQGREPEVPTSVRRATVETIPVELSDPTQHADIYDRLRRQVVPRLGSVAGRLHVNVSPGTPAMHAVWLILHASGTLPDGATLWSSQYSRGRGQPRVDPVTFAVTTYLAEVHRLERAEPGRAMYNPEAHSQSRRAAFERLSRYARVPGAPLLILGERGTGKSRLVETHVAAFKGRENVVTVPCGGLDSSLAESLLFGHRRGAFTGASSDRPGLLGRADGGVLFLDEVQDLPRPAQRKLVRVFQDRRRRYRPLGSDEEKSVDVELVCASNLPVADLREQLDADLFDRLSHLVVEVPPLRDCREDLLGDWARVWSELRTRQDFPREAPVTAALVRVLEASSLLGNLRDLQRLAVLVMAWWSDHDVEGAVEAASEEWSRWAPKSAADAGPLGSGSRDERIRSFRGRLARWAKGQYGTWDRAGEALGCNEKTLRQDAALP